jgi:hypothetical protein
MKNANDGGVGGENSETDRGDDSSEENDGHQKRIHDLPTFTEAVI